MTRILVVDDDRAITRLVEGVLVAEGYSVTTCASASEADRIYESGERFDLLLSDLVMPDDDGESLARRLKGLQPRLIVLYMSGYAEGPDLAYEHGATIGKPFTPRTLVQAVRETVG